MVNNSQGLKGCKGSVVCLSPYLADEDRPDYHFDHCICADIPDEKRIDLQVKRYSEKSGKWRWISLDTTHQDCVVHGVNRKDLSCPED